MDPYSEYGSGSRKLLNTDPIRIRIHNTGCRSHVIGVAVMIIFVVTTRPIPDLPVPNDDGQVPVPVKDLPDSHHRCAGPRLLCLHGTGRDHAGCLRHDYRSRFPPAVCGMITGPAIRRLSLLSVFRIRNILPDPIKSSGSDQKIKKNKKI